MAGIQSHQTDLINLLVQEVRGVRGELGKLRDEVASNKLSMAVLETKMGFISAIVALIVSAIGNVAVKLFF